MKPATERFKTGEYVRFKGSPNFGLFLITKVEDMTGWFGWDNGSALIYMQQPNGKPMPCAVSSCELLPEREYQVRKKAASKPKGKIRTKASARSLRFRRMVRQLNIKLSITDYGSLRITHNNRGDHKQRPKSAVL